MKKIRQAAGNKTQHCTAPHNTIESKVIISIHQHQYCASKFDFDFMLRDSFGDGNSGAFWTRQNEINQIEKNWWNRTTWHGYTAIAQRMKIDNGKSYGVCVAIDVFLQKAYDCSSWTNTKTQRQRNDSNREQQQQQKMCMWNELFVHKI